MVQRRRRKKVEITSCFFLAVFSDFSMSDNDFRKWERVRLGERDRERMRERKEEVECVREKEGKEVKKANNIEEIVKVERGILSKKELET
jgi:hypothetical protein